MPATGKYTFEKNKYLFDHIPTVFAMRSSGASIREICEKVEGIENRKVSRPTMTAFVSMVMDSDYRKRLLEERQKELEILQEVSQLNQVSHDLERIKRSLEQAPRVKTSPKPLITQKPSAMAETKIARSPQDRGQLEFECLSPFEKSRISSSKESLKALSLRLISSETEAAPDEIKKIIYNLGYKNNISDDLAIFIFECIKNNVLF